MSLHSDTEEIGMTTTVISDCLTKITFKIRPVVACSCVSGDQRKRIDCAVCGNVLCFNSLGAAIFFEFKHYKPKKRFTSTKCFAFMEMDEIKPGPIVIEL